MQRSNDVIIPIGEPDNPPIPFYRTAIANCVNYLPSAKSFAYSIAAVITTLPATVYAFTFPLGISPDSLSWELWASLSPASKSIAIAFTLVTLGIGSLTRYQYFPAIEARLKQLLSGYFENLPAFLNANLILGLATLAAISTVSLGYYGFTWAGEATAITGAIINFLITFGIRVDSVPEMINRIRNMFSKDYQFQRELIHILNKLTPEDIEIFETALKNKINSGSEINETILCECLMDLFDNLSNRYTTQQTLDIIHPVDAVNNIKSFLRKTIDFGLGTLTGCTSIFFFGQYGFDGFNILIKQANMDSWPYAGKMALALIASSSSGIVGFLSGSDITDTLDNAYSYMKRDYNNIPKMIFVYMGGGISATSFAGATNSLTKKPNLFFVTEGGAAAYILIGGSWIFATAFDSNAITRLLTKNDVTHNNALTWTKHHKLSAESVAALKEHSFFKRMSEESRPLLPQNTSPRISPI